MRAGTCIGRRTMRQPDPLPAPCDCCRRRDPGCMEPGRRHSARPPAAIATTPHAHPARTRRRCVAHGHRVGRYRRSSAVRSKASEEGGIPNPCGAAPALFSLFTAGSWDSEICPTQTLSLRHYRVSHWHSPTAASRASLSSGGRSGMKQASPSQRTGLGAEGHVAVAVDKCAVVGYLE